MPPSLCILLVSHSRSFFLPFFLSFANSLSLQTLFSPLSLSLSGQEDIFLVFLMALLGPRAENQKPDLIHQNFKGEVCYGIVLNKFSCPSLMCSQL